MVEHKTIRSWVVLFFLVFSLLSSNYFTFTIDTVIADIQTYENEYGKLTVEPATSRNLIRQRQYYNATWYYPDNTLDVAFCFNESLSYGGIYYWNGSNYNKVNHNYIVYNNKHYYVLENIFFTQDETKHGYWEYDTPPGSNGKWDMYLKLSSDTWQEAFQQNRIVHLDPWWNSSWTHRVKITINSDYISSTLTNFPILVNSTNTSIINKCNSSGEDVRFVSEDNSTEYAHEIEEWTATGFNIWVNVTSISSGGSFGSTDIYMYYNNSAAADGQNIAGVWDSDFLAVYHMNDSDGGLTDATSNGDDATEDVSDPSDADDYEDTGKISYAVNYDGTGSDDDSENHDVPTIMSNAEWEAGFTISCWVKFADAGSNYHTFLSFRDSSCVEIRLDNNGTFNFWTYDDGNSYQNLWYESGAAGCWYYVVGTYDSSNKIFYINGTNVDNGIEASLKNQSNENNIGAGYGDDWGMDGGIIDDVRISKVARSSSWVNASYHTGNQTTGFLIWGDEESEVTDATAPTNFVAETDADGDIDLSWTNGTGNTQTMVEWNTVSSWLRGSGTVLYNSTNNVTSFTTGSCDIIYYFQAWGYNSTSGNFSGSYSSDYNISCPGNPTSVTVSLVVSDLNFTWVAGNYADTTLVVYKSNSFPSSETDGTVLYNGSNTYYDDTNFVSSRRYTLFSFNNTVNQYSTGVQSPWGAILINVYDENTSLAITNWSVFISNEDGSETYESLTNNNTLFVNVEDIPYGDDTVIRINASDYDSKIFIMDLVVNTYYSLDAYLSQTVDTELYVFFVVNEFDEPIEDATVYIKRYINDTEGYQNASILRTDAQGQFSLHLIPNMNYLIEIVKSGYETEYSQYIPDPDYHGPYYPTTFRLQFSREAPDIITAADIISFNGTINSDGNITIWYDDVNSHTTNTAIYIYEYYETTLSLNHTDSRTGQNSFSFTTTGYNTSRTHKLILYLNHTDLDYEILTFLIYPLRTTVDESTLEDRFDNVFGNFDLGYVKTFIIYIPSIFFLIVFGALHVGLGILSSGLYLGFTTLFLNITSETSTIEGVTVYVAIASLFIVVGFLMIIIKRGRAAI